MKRLPERACAVCVPLLLAAMPAAQAQPGVVSKINPDCHQAGASGYWTPERFKQAKPMPLPVVKPKAGVGDVPETRSAERPVGSDAHAPSEEPVPAVEQLDDAGTDINKLQRDAGPQPRDR